jgi:hypothetical protein
MRTTPILVAAIAIAAISPHARACSACGCTLYSDWGSQGLVAGGGWHMDVRYDFFEQDQLRSGTDSVPRSSITFPTDQEVQQYTINRNVALALDYSPNRDWGISMTLPWFDRSHATIAAGDTGISTSHDRGIGDARVVGRYSGFDEQRSTGILFGIKLPTGDFTDTFDSGPQQGEIVDRGLQLGTGTTDVILGAYHFGAWSSDWGYFTQAMAQAALNSRDGFKPGAGLNLNAGLRYTASPTWVPAVQLNLRTEKREEGINADVENSGATLLYLSPGITWNPNPRTSAFLFFQAPLHQRVNGLQLEATQLVSLGLHYHF